MSFTVPTFNLTVDIYNVILPSTTTLRSTTPCNLAMGRRINWILSAALTGQGTEGSTPMLLLPALTDIRDASTGQESDIVEVPSGSGRWYQVRNVDDVGKGFPNEYRMATIEKIYNYSGYIALGIPNWPAPIP